MDRELQKSISKQAPGSYNGHCNWLPDHMTDEKQPIDVSAFTYDQWVECLFKNHGQATHQAFGGPFNINHPSITIEYSTRLFNDSAALSKRFTANELDQAIWFLCSRNLNPQLLECLVATENNINQFLHARVCLPPQQDRLDCIRSIYIVFAHFIAGSSVSQVSRASYFWWHLICVSFWGHATSKTGSLLPRRKPAEHYDLLDDSERLVLDTICETMLQILKLDDHHCQECAIYGLASSNHPEANSLIQNFLDHLPQGWDNEKVKWIEECRDGTVSHSESVDYQFQH